MSTPALDFWFDFASTYSYLAVGRIGPVAAEAGVEVRFRPFLLGPIFKAQGWDTSPFNLYSAKGHNMWRDLERLSEDFGLPFRRPEPFPQNSLLPARVALVGLQQGWGERFCGEVSQPCALKIGPSRNGRNRTSTLASAASGSIRRAAG